MEYCNLFNILFIIIFYTWIWSANTWFQSEVYFRFNSKIDVSRYGEISLYSIYFNYFILFTQGTNL